MIFKDSGLLNTLGKHSQSPQSHLGHVVVVFNTFKHEFFKLTTLYLGKCGFFWLFVHLDFFQTYLFLIEEKLLYNIVLASGTFSFLSFSFDNFRLAEVAKTEEFPCTLQ